HALLKDEQNPMLFQTLCSLWHLLNARMHLFFITHLKSHTSLPGPLVEGNRRADELVTVYMSSSSPLPNVLGQARLSHNFFHQSAKALRNPFKTILSDACAIVAACPDCAKLPNLQAEATNPRGLAPLQLWQTDITEYSPVGRLKYIHVSVDTYSHMFWATLHPSSNSKAVQKHLLSCFAVMGVPSKIKTDNGPGYKAETLARFLHAWGVSHLFGIPYNSTGQAIIERTHCTLKDFL
ncbi:hypothetical protein N311_10126, partial [Apaloderma vittatum]